MLGLRFFSLNCRLHESSDRIVYFCFSPQKLWGECEITIKLIYAGIYEIRNLEHKEYMRKKLVGSYYKNKFKMEKKKERKKKKGVWTCDRAKGVVEFFWPWKAAIQYQHLNSYVIMPRSFPLEACGLVYRLFLFTIEYHLWGVHFGKRCCVRCTGGLKLSKLWHYCIVRWLIWTELVIGYTNDLVAGLTILSGICTAEYYHGLLRYGMIGLMCRAYFIEWVLR